MYQLGCKATNPLACFFLGTLYENGHGVVRNTKRAAKLYKFSCDASWPLEACWRLANLVEKGDGVPKNLEYAASLYKKRCNEYGHTVVIGKPETTGKCSPRKAQLAISCHSMIHCSSQRQWSGVPRTIKVSWKVTTNSKVHRTQILSSTLNSPEVEKCVLDHIKTLYDLNSPCFIQLDIQFGISKK
ncbi:MAG: hypothetical protein AAGJ35_07755 [Myxococcota bacterium]